MNIIIITNYHNNIRKPNTKTIEKISILSYDFKYKVLNLTGFVWRIYYKSNNYFEIENNSF